MAGACAAGTRQTAHPGARDRGINHLAEELAADPAAKAAARDAQRPGRRGRAADRDRACEDDRGAELRHAELPADEDAVGDAVADELEAPRRRRDEAAAEDARDRQRLT